MNKGKWINGFARVWKTKNNNFILSIPLAEPVTMKLERRNKEGEVSIEDVTLIPTKNEAGYTSVVINLSEPKEEYRLSPSHTFDLSVPALKE